MYRTSFDAQRCLRKMRHRLCDCVIESTLGPDDDGAREIVTAHRAVLAHWPYFESLFAHTDPVRVDVGAGGDGTAKGTYRLVYSVAIPFATSSVRALVDMAYDGRIALLDDPGTCDPVDVINCAVYLGDRERDVHCLVAHVVQALLSHVPSTSDEARAKSPDVGAFVLHMLASDLGESTKRNLAARLYRLMPDTDRTVAAETYADIMQPDQLYGAKDAVSGLQLCCDRITAPRNEVRAAVGDATTTATVVLRPTVIDCTDGITMTMRVDSTAAAVWHCQVRFFHPIEACEAYQSITVHAGTEAAWGFADYAISSVYRSDLTACQIDLWPAA